MEPKDRPHRATTTSGASELFICFTSRPSNTSNSAATTMRVPPPSPSCPRRAPVPHHSPPPSAAASVAAAASKAGEQSPMFPAAVTAAAARKKGCSFEAAEPSSPKVTCIGQVRPWRGLDLRGEVEEKPALEELELELEKVRRSAGLGGFVRLCVRLDRRSIALFRVEVVGGLHFVHLQRLVLKWRRRRGGKGLLVVVLCLGWMMAVQESEEGKGGEVVGLVVQENGRREVSLVVEKVEEEKERVEMEVEVVEENRGSVCVPPKNALLLMRCRSDPVRMAALATRFWGSPAAAKVGAEEGKKKKKKKKNNNNSKERRRRSCCCSCKEDTAGVSQRRRAKRRRRRRTQTKAMDSEKVCSKVEAGETKRELPDCLLLMMYEPKLSMEVSKETWVCSTDFLQWRPKEVVPAAPAPPLKNRPKDPAPPLSEEVRRAGWHG
ncbi:uncharacterized protein LOC120257086 [Dioscorea cayenensis subsp. rotundata]|uniref:Uncharacterized protein LOC120257086 n=1 Tax=Dioscorea cayennensis subsp. rotundata TaxID=55577 RepID=A0AB40B0N0_DIOCR|nr:uncharacterized protein LOC120257086 [Dioscorea cayenensis subsp. rotundata]